MIRERDKYIYWQNNIIYMLAEYSSNDDIYKVFLTLLKAEKKYIIQKFKNHLLNIPEFNEKNENYAYINEWNN